MSDALKKIREAREVHFLTGEKFETDAFSTDFVLLFAFLHDELYEGKRCERGTILVIVEDGTYKLCLNDREAKMKGFVTAPSFTAAFQAAERGLGEGTIDWRPEKARGASKWQR